MTNHRRTYKNAEVMPSEEEWASKIYYPRGKKQACFSRLQDKSRARKGRRRRAKNKELNSLEENWGLCKGQGGREEGGRALRNERRPMWLWRRPEALAPEGYETG